ncbi:MAG: hypothetical protein ACO3YA_03950 [Candidatus Nanopelagicaceae bacterium]
MKFIIYFHQQWVGDHSLDWFQARGPMARAVVEDMKEAGVLVIAGGLDEDIQKAIGVNANGEITAPISLSGDYLGGLTIIEVENEIEAKKWGAKVAIACGWPQEIREIK